MGTPFQKHPQAQSNYTTTFSNYIEDFRHAIVSAGLTPPTKIVDDGQRHRFSSNGKRGDDAGWYVFYPDSIVAGAFGCWRAQFTQSWCSKSPSTMTPAERESYRKRMDDTRAQVEAETNQRNAEAAKLAKQIWNDAEPADSHHPYLVNKSVHPNGLRHMDDGLISRYGGSDFSLRYRRDALIVPLYNGGELVNLQFIMPDGKKRPLIGGKVKGSYSLIGDATNAKTLLVAEGFATAASLHEATGFPAVVALSAGNLEKAARAMQKQYPGVSLMICGDDDVTTDGNPGRTEATKAAEACGGVAVFPSAGTDFNDMAQSEGLDAVKAIITGAMPAKWFQPISADEWHTARLSPDCIVENYLFADVALLIAPGGVGKTTLILYEAICITLGLPLYGRKIARPGPVAILTAEDGRELLIARLNRIAGAMGLTVEQVARVQRSVLIEYVGNSPFRLTEVVGDAVVLSPTVDSLISRIKPLNPAVVVIDPAVSFGVGESRVNDAEQGLVMAARRIRDAVNCCVRYVHHTGKGNARDKTIDQYSGRGGSAFADGARMVSVLQSLEPGEWKKATGEPLPNGCTGMVLALPKLSYAPPQEDIFIERDGYSYRSITAQAEQSAEGIRSSHDAMVLDFITEQHLAGVHYSRKSIEDSGRTELRRNDLRAAISRLVTDGKLLDEKGKNNSRTLIPTAIKGDADEAAYLAASRG